MPLHRLNTLLGTALVVFTASASALPVISSHLDDASIRSTQADNSVLEVSRQNDSAVVAGYDSTSGNQYASVGILFFELPALAAGEFFDNASLSLRIVPQNSPTPNMDAYILGIQSNTAIDISWYFQGTAGSAPAGDTLLQASLGTSETAGAGRNVTTSAAANNTLLGFLNANYDGNGSQYLALRLNLDEAIAGGLLVDGPRYFIGSSTNAFEPQLTLTAIPEPSTYAAILGLMVMGLVARRRFRR